MPRFWIIVALLAAAVLIPFALWGDRIEAVMVLDRETGRFGDLPLHPGLAAVSLMLADIVLPIPKSAVIAGLGILYGPLVGTLWALAGSMLAALTAYGIGRALGRTRVRRWLGPELARGEALFARHGALLVAGSRWMPVLAEVIPVVAGLHRMAPGRFVLAALLGALPEAAVFATLGHLGADRPVLTMVLVALIPVLLWFLFLRPRLRRGAGSDAG